MLEIKTLESASSACESIKLYVNVMNITFAYLKVMVTPSFALAGNTTLLQRIHSVWITTCGKGYCKGLI